MRFIAPALAVACYAAMLVLVFAGHTVWGLFALCAGWAITGGMWVEGHLNRTYPHEEQP